VIAPVLLAVAACSSPVELTTEEDHRRTLGLLGIASLRPGADGRNPEAPNAVNYDESRVRPYPPLPDPLTLKSGGRVTTAREWWEKRRPEIVEDFDREIYGRMPAVTPAVRWAVTATRTETVGGVSVIARDLVGHVDNSTCPKVTVDIQATLTTPSGARGPVPVVVQLAFAGPRPGAPAPPPGPTWQEQVLAKGWGFASLAPTTVQPDNGASLTKGIIGLVNGGQPRKVDDWGALRAWGWGASRLLDYLETDKTVDAKRVALQGHSRYGKATLVAMADDPRFAVAFVSSSGAGGAKIHRRTFGELLENVAAPGEYHWMAGNYVKYAGPLTPNDLPVDAHELVALCAPRPVFVSAGAVDGDGWVDAKGMFLAAAGAGPVYRLLGKKDLGTTDFPAIETALVDGDVAFRQHGGGHTAGPNWPTFLAFAARYFERATPPAAPARAKVALTFDDLPVHGPLPPGTSRLDVARSILAALRAAKAPPTYGFINAKTADTEETREFLALWRAAGHPLANHSFSHMDLDASTVADFGEDVARNEPVLRDLMGGGDWRWFRYPYLREGNTDERRRGVRDFLRERGYRVAQVTLDFWDWAYNAPYARCEEKGDAKGIEWLKESYLSEADAWISKGQRDAKQLYGRDVKHVMLLHVGALQVVMLPRLLDLLERRGFELVELEEAQEDPVYAEDPGLPFEGGRSFLQQVFEARKLDSSSPLERPADRLAAACR
jgi:peptidoglycan/xylan/chitin deacetylase (PgdA/CDA1 family)